MFLANNERAAMTVDQSGQATALPHHLAVVRSSRGSVQPPFFSLSNFPSAAPVRKNRRRALVSSTPFLRLARTTSLRRSLLKLRAAKETRLG